MKARTILFFFFLVLTITFSASAHKPRRTRSFSVVKTTADVAVPATAEPSTFIEKCVKIFIVDYGWVWPAVCGFAVNSVVDGAINNGLTSIGVDPVTAGGLAQGVANTIGVGTSMATNKAINSAKTRYQKAHPAVAPAA